MAAILARVLLGARAKETLADQPQRDGARRRAGQLPLMRVVPQHASNARERRRKVPDAMVFAQLAFFHGPRVVPILLSAASVESPGLDAVPGVGGDVHVPPGGRDAKRRDALQRARGAH